MKIKHWKGKLERCFLHHRAADGKEAQPIEISYVFDLRQLEYFVTSSQVGGVCSRFHEQGVPASSLPFLLLLHSIPDEQSFERAHRLVARSVSLLRE
jgi:hypothetical protein